MTPVQSQNLDGRELTPASGPLTSAHALTQMISE